MTRRLFPLAVAVIVCAFSACDDDDNDTAVLDSNKAIVRQLFEDAVNGRNLDLFDEFLTADFRYHGPGGEELDVAGSKAMVAGYLAAFPDIHVSVDFQAAEGDLVTTRFTVTGTHDSDMPGIPATGRQININAISIMRLVDGQIAEEWENFDEVGMLRQIGALPEM